MLILLIFLLISPQDTQAATPLSECAQSVLQSALRFKQLTHLQRHAEHLKLVNSIDRTNINSLKKSLIEKIHAKNADLEKIDELRIQIAQTEDQWIQKYNQEARKAGLYELTAMPSPRHYTEQYNTGFPNETQVQYFNKEQLEKLKVTFDVEGKIYVNKKLYSTIDANSTDTADFVMMPDGTIYITTQSEYGKIHHSSLSNGAPIVSAGEIVISRGRIVKISNNSGHYFPHPDTLEQFFHQLKQNGYNHEEIKKITVIKRSPPPKSLLLKQKFNFNKNN